jgi:dTDP-4-dehydrorhamnose reductase
MSTLKKILVTGSKGQLGQELQVIAPDCTEFEFHFHDVDTFDITNDKQVAEFVSKLKPAYVINCAAYTAVDKAESDEVLAFAINSKGPGNLAEACKANKCRFIQISTDYVFDGTISRPLLETDPVNPMGVYGKSKLGGEQLSLQYDQTLIIRTAWLYSSFGGNFVKTMLRLGKEKETINVVNDQIGTPTYAADLAITIMQIITQVESGQLPYMPGIYHFANEGACSWFDFASEIMQQANLSCKIISIPCSAYPTAAIRPQYSVLSKEKIKSNYRLVIPWWKDSLHNCLGILLRNS